MDVYQRRRLVALSILVGVFIILVLLIRSCGGDDEPTEVTPVAGATGVGTATSLSQTDYVDQADAVCLEANTAFADIDESDPEQAATDQGQTLAGELESLQTLPPPEDGADQLDAFLQAVQDQISAYDDKITAIQRGDDTASAELDATIEEAEAKAAKAAGKFGFEVCGDPSQVGESSGGGGGGAETTTPTETGGAVAPVTPTTPVAPVVPTTPTEPAPTEGGSVTPTPAPTAPAPTDDGSGSGGITP